MIFYVQEYDKQILYPIYMIDGDDVVPVLITDSYDKMWAYRFANTLNTRVIQGYTLEELKKLYAL